jgi:GntR family transcriptional regulator, transcriptional repressor for pyruvate dehydrogenase complex
MGPEATNTSRTRSPLLPSLKDELARTLQWRIHSGQIVTGERLPSEKDLAQQYGVSRDTCRQALSVLETEGYIVRRRGSLGGTFVTDLEAPAKKWLSWVRNSIGVFEDHIDFLVGIEARAAVLAARRRSDEDLDAMQAAYDLFPENEEDWTRRGRKSDIAFHAAVLTAARSSRLERAIHDARGELWFPGQWLDYRIQGTEIREEMLEILVAIRAQDGIRAGQAMETHLEYSRRELRSVIRTIEDGTT